ncbi:hypothetical protein PMAYCL1PPCAC_10154, partial [Pristionchus mayeri]
LKMSLGPPSLVEASTDMARAFSMDADPRALADAIDSYGQVDETATRARIEKYKKKVMDRHRTTGVERVQALSDNIHSLETARDLNRGLFVAEGLVLSKHLGIGREVKQSLGIEKEAPPLPPRKGFISTQQLNNAGSRSPHFNRRSVSRSRVRSELTGDSPSMAGSSPYSTPSTISIAPVTPGTLRPFGNSFNAAVAARDAALAKQPARTRSNLFSAAESGLGATSTLRSPMEVERIRNFDRDRAMTTPTSYGVPTNYSPSLSTATSVTNRLYDEQMRHSASSSPTSLTSSAAPTVVHVPPSAILRANVGLCARAAGANEVADSVLAEGLVRALNGFETPYFRLSDGVFRMSAGCAVSGTKRGRMLRVLQVASHAHAMSAASCQGSDLLTDAFIMGIQETRRRFAEEVMALARERGSNLDTRAIDLVLHGKWAVALARAASLAALVKQPQIKGMTILHELYAHYTALVNTGGMEEEVIMSLLSSVMFVFSNLLREWLLEGSLNFRNTEFLIKEKAGHGGEQGEAAMVKSWQTRFNLDTELIPLFLDRNLPKMILSVGKCARLLASDDVDDELSRHRTRVANLDLMCLSRLNENERMVIGKDLEEIEQSICGLVVERLLHRDELKEHLRAIHHIFLCLNERYATHLFEAIEMMCRDVRSVSATRTQHAASLAFIAAARTAALSFPFKLPVDAAVKENCSPASTPASSARSAFISASGAARGCDRSRITVTPTYKAPRLAAIVLSKGAIEHYQALFHTIWPVYSTRLALAEARNELLFIADASRKLGTGTSSSLRAFQLAMSTAGAFFDNLIRYFIQGVGVYAAQLMARLDAAGTVEECIKAHKRFLLTMADHVGTTLSGDKRGTSKLTAAIQSARGVLLDEASALLDIFWTWSAEAEREQLLRAQKSDELEMGADAQSVTLQEFEKLEEKMRREEVEKSQVASSAKIMAIFDRFSLQMTKYIDLYDTDGKANDLSKLLLALKVKRRNVKDVPMERKRLDGPSQKWISIKT